MAGGNDGLRVWSFVPHSYRYRNDKAEARDANHCNEWLSAHIRVSIEWRSKFYCSISSHRLQVFSTQLDLRRGRIKIFSHDHPITES